MVKHCWARSTFSITSWCWFHWNMQDKRQAVFDYVFVSAEVCWDIRWKPEGPATCLYHLDVMSVEMQAEIAHAHMTKADAYVRYPMLIMAPSFVLVCSFPWNDRCCFWFKNQQLVTTVQTILRLDSSFYVPVHDAVGFKRQMAGPKKVHDRGQGKNKKD